VWAPPATACSPDVLAYTGSTWTEVVITGSIIVPVVVTAVVAYFFLRHARNDPDAERLRRAQREYEARRRQ